MLVLKENITEKVFMSLPNGGKAVFDPKKVKQEDYIMYKNSGFDIFREETDMERATREVEQYINYGSE